ncbi:MAG: hypothetical protein EAZ36_02430, partial [Verrucomicrobia bacterium]
MEAPFSKISHVRLTGSSGGAVKSLRAYDKSRHSVPDAVNAATSGFLARLCAPELAEEAEGMFQSARTRLGYKRAGISLDLGAAQATLTTKDFCWELAYALELTEPARFSLTRSLHSLRSGEVARGRRTASEAPSHSTCAATLGTAKVQRLQSEGYSTLRAASAFGSSASIASITASTRTP